MEETFPPTQGRAVGACACAAPPQSIYSDPLCVRYSPSKPSPHSLPSTSYPLLAGNHLPIL